MNEHNQEYWRKRMGEVTNTSLELTAKAMKEMQEQFEAMGREISKEINDLLSRYPNKNQLLKRADKSDINRLKVMMKIMGYDVDNPAVMKNIYKLNRLEATIQQISLIVEQYYGGGNDLLYNHFKDVYGGVTTKLAKDFEQMGMHTNPNMLVISKDQLQQVLTEPWSGKNYSNIWANHRDVLGATLKSVLRDGFLSGLSMNEMTKILQNKLGVSYSNAVRLIRTETIYVSNQGALNSFKNSGVVEWFKFDAHLDNRTSEICTMMDMEDKVYHISEASIGVNVPPLHPNCRSTIIPYIPKYEKDGYLYPTTYSDYIDKAKAEEETRKKAEADRLADKYGNKVFKDKNEIVRHLKNECGFQTVSLRGFDMDIATDIGNILGRLFNKYPEMKGKVEAFDPKTSSENAYASITTWSNKITGNWSKMHFNVNPKLMGSIEQATKSYIRDLSSGFHPANTSYKDILVHEVGHILDNIVGGQKYSDNFVKDIAQKSFKEMGYENSQQINETVKELSKYATQNYKELWAEAFADYYCNGDNANPLSKALYKEFDKKYQQLKLK